MKNKFVLAIFSIITIAIFSLNQIFAQNKPPKNIIIMIGDGMGENQIKAGTYYQYGIDEAQNFHKFPVKLFVSTYAAKAGSKGEDKDLDWSIGYNTKEAWEKYDWVQNQYTCSGASGTAIACGEKTYNGAIGMDVNKRPIENACEVAKKLNKSAGVVTSVMLSHATPAVFVAHNEHRNNYSAIAKEMLLDSKVDVIIGAGHPYFNHDGEKLAHARTFQYVGDSLIWVGLQKGAVEFVVDGKKKTVADIDGDNIPDAWSLVEKKQDLEKIARGSIIPKRLLGVVEVAETFQQRRKTSDDKSYFDGKGQAMEEAYVVPFNKNVPDLATVSLAALNTLNKNKNGFFLMIEGGAIDWACHGNQKGRLIEEFIDFAIAVDSVIAWIESNSSWDETLLIITADHETGYLTGVDNEKIKPFDKPIKNNGKGKMPDMQFNSTSHTNTLVPFFAKGAGANLFELLADEIDQKKGKYLQNSEIGAGVKILWQFKN
jgi:alkaline phosphatase